MAINGSRRAYATIQEVDDSYDITVTNEQISQAEELIDSYVGYQKKFNPQDWRGQVSSVAGKVITDTNSNTLLGQTDGYFKNAEILIVGGTGSGQTNFISDSNKDTKSITVRDDWTTPPDTTSVFLIHQLAKFPRVKDSFQNSAGTIFYKTIPDAVKRAVCAQLKYMDELGSDFFDSDGTDKESESIGNYSYSKGGGSSGMSASVKMISPRARTLLRGIKNSTGRLVPENPTCL